MKDSAIRLFQCFIPVYKGAQEAILGDEPNHCSENIFFGKDGLSDQPREFPEVWCAEGCINEASSKVDA